MSGNRWDLKMPVLRGSLERLAPPDELCEQLRAEVLGGFTGQTGDELPLVVTPQSPASHRHAVRQLSVYFQREFGYDTPQYSDGGYDPGARAYLWWVPDGARQVVIGACHFQWTEWRDAAPCWALAWVWLHPYERRKGHLSRAWPYFRARFGEFYLEQPLSAAMQGFIRRHEPAWAARYGPLRQETEDRQALREARG